MKFKFHWIVLIFVLTIVIFHFQGLNNDFRGDDYSYLNQNWASTYQSYSDFFTKVPAQYYNPLDQVLNVTLFSYIPHKPFIFRLINLLFLLINAMLFYFTIHHIFRRQNIAILSGLFLIAHPFTAETIGQVTLNTILLNCIFVQSAFLLFCMHAKSKDYLKYFLALLFFVLSLLTWEGSIVFPCSLIFYGWCVLKKDFLSSVKSSIPFIFASVIYFFVWRSFVLSEFSFVEVFKSLDISLVQYFSSLINLVSWYFTNIILAKSIVFVYNVDPFHLNFSLLSGVLSLFLMGILISIIMKNKRGVTTFYVGWFLFGLFLIFPASLAHSRLGLVIEPNWFFLSNLGIYVVFAYIICRVAPKLSKLILTFLLIGVFSYLFIFSYWQHVLGATPLSYARNWEKVCPTNTMALEMVGKYYYDNGEFSKAKFYYEKIINSSNPGYPIYVAMADILVLEDSNFDTARQYLDQAFEMSDVCTTCYQLLAVMSFKENDMINVESYLKQALLINSKDALIRMKLGDFYFLEGLYFHSWQEYEKALTFTNSFEMKSTLSWKLDVLRSKSISQM